MRKVAVVVHFYLQTPHNQPISNLNSSSKAPQRLSPHYINMRQSRRNFFQPFLSNTTNEETKN